MIVIYKEPNKNGKLEFTKKELEALLEQAREEGYAEGCNSRPYTYPTVPDTATDPYKPIGEPWKVTCAGGAWACDSTTNPINV